MNTGITFSSAAQTSLSIATKTIASLSTGKITEYGTVSATGMLAGSSIVEQTITLNYYHKCYYATVTATAGKISSATYTVATTANSNNIGTFSSIMPGTASTQCDLDITLWYSNLTQVLPGVQSAFVFPLTLSALTTVGVIYQADNFNVGIFNLVLKASVKYGTQVAQLTSTYEIKGNPCLTASVSLPATSTTILASLTVASGLYK